MFVANQPQFRLAIPLLAVSWIFGSLIQSFFTGEKLQEYLESAKRSLPPGIQISHSLGYISLADGWAPEFALVLKNVNIKVSSTCLVDPDIQIASLRVPLLGLAGRDPSWSLKLGETVLTLRSPFEKCFNQQVISRGETHVNTDLAAPLGAPSPEVTRTGEGRLNHLFIEKLIVHDFSRAQPIIGLEWRFLNWHRKKDTSDWTSDFQFQIPGAILGTSSSLRVITQLESERNLLNMKAKGFWREGIFEVSAVSDLEKKDLNLDFDFTDLSFEAILSALRHFKFLQSEFIDVGKNWFSAKGKLVYSTQDLKINLDQIELQGDLGTIRLKNPLELNSEFKPANLNSNVVLLVERLSLHFLSQLIPQKSIVRSIRNFGQISGELTFDQGAYSFEGNLSQLSFIFSNFGSRADQVINSCNLNMKHSKTSSQFLLNSCSIEGGQFLGELQVEVRDLDDYNVALSISQLSLTQRVQKVLSGGGIIGPMSGKIELSKADDDPVFKGELSLERSVLAQTQIDKATLSVSGLGSQSEIKIRGVGVFDGRLDYLNFLRSSLLFQPQELKSEFQGIISVEGPRAWSWKNVEINNQDWSLKSSGSFDQFERLSGILDFRKKVESQETHFQIVGTRSVPRLELLLK